MEFLTEPAFLALLGTLFGGVVLKIVETFLGRKKTQVDLATQIRDELRLQLTEVKAELDRVEQQLTEWRDKYYALVEDYTTFKAECLRQVHEALAAGRPEKALIDLGDLTNIIDHEGGSASKRRTEQVLAEVDQKLDLLEGETETLWFPKRSKQ